MTECGDKMTDEEVDEMLNDVSNLLASHKFKIFAKYSDHSKQLI